MYYCSRKIHFCYGHRVMEHENKCANLHGHNGVIWVYAKRKNGLDSIGRIVDFSVLKEKIGGWIDQNWDHTMILFKEDHCTIELLNKVHKSKPIYLLDENPTAENMAIYLMNKICPNILIGTDIEIIKIEFWETENCKVEVVKERI
jgi:6-pyruvoyltetrahydropterin/6-carboxytetrahydropterin synthase